jgi:cell division transport system ATP-binding protein
MISFQQVSKSYGDYKALDEVSFSLDKGSMTFLTGHSGAGKTTLLKLILLMEKVSRGNILIDSQNTNLLHKKQLPHYRRKIGMVFQTPTLLKNKNIYDNIAIPLTIAGVIAKEQKKRIHAALDKVNLLSKAKCLPDMLSSGEQQRMGIARAIVNRPEIILADEPTGNLDPQLSKDIIKLFGALNDIGVTVLVATHDLTMIASLRYPIINLEKGKLC